MVKKLLMKFAKETIDIINGKNSFLNFIKLVYFIPVKIKQLLVILTSNKPVNHYGRTISASCSISYLFVYCRQFYNAEEAIEQTLNEFQALQQVLRRVWKVQWGITSNTR